LSNSTFEAVQDQEIQDCDLTDIVPVDEEEDAEMANFLQARENLNSNFHLEDDIENIYAL
jgi:hypothetical protein